MDEFLDSDDERLQMQITQMGQENGGDPEVFGSDSAGASLDLDNDMAAEGDEEYDDDQFDVQMLC